MNATTSRIEVRDESETTGGITWSVSAVLSDGEREILSAHGSYMQAARAALAAAGREKVTAYAELRNGGLMMI